MRRRPLLFRGGPLLQGPPRVGRRLGLAFGLSHFLFWRTLDHLDLALAWHVPLCILVVTWAFSRRGPASDRAASSPPRRSRSAPPLHNPYYAALYAQFLLLAGLAQALRRRTRRAALGPLALVRLLAPRSCSTTRARSPILAQRPQPGRRAPLREPRALRPQAARAGRRAARLRSRELGRAARRRPLGAPASTRARAARPTSASSGPPRCCGSRGDLGRRPSTAGPRRAPAAAAAIAWILAYSVLGGVNQVAGILGLRLAARHEPLQRLDPRPRVAPSRDARPDPAPGRRASRRPWPWPPCAWPTRCPSEATAGRWAARCTPWPSTSASSAGSRPRCRLEPCSSCSRSPISPKASRCRTSASTTTCGRISSRTAAALQLRHRQGAAPRGLAAPAGRAAAGAHGRARSRVAASRASS